MCPACSKPNCTDPRRELLPECPAVPLRHSLGLNVFPMLYGYAPSLRREGFRAKTKLLSLVKRYKSRRRNP